MLNINNPEILPFIKAQYTLEEINKIQNFLYQKGVFEFHPMSNGLFSASIINGDSKSTGYSNVWVRDNIHIAHAHYSQGFHEIASKNLTSLMLFFQKESQRQRLINIIENPILAIDPMKRPHIRFDGENLDENNEDWGHAQNDALGYFLWFYCKLVFASILNLSRKDAELLTLFALYFDAIQYWKDEDSGHWEEIRKINASSIGVVVAGLEELKKVISQSNKPSLFKYKGKTLQIQKINEMIHLGRVALQNILPSECIQTNPLQYRPVDAALLFLVYPLRVVDDEIENLIIENVITHLQGNYGIKRYLGDSYWGKDYKKKIHASLQTADFSENISERNSLFTEPDTEAQWCLFDPIISVIYGLKFQATRQYQYLEKQTAYFNRALGQITLQKDNIPGFKCPELYYSESGSIVSNNNVPLLWTQANLLMAIDKMKENLTI